MIGSLQLCQQLAKIANLPWIEVDELVKTRCICAKDHDTTAAYVFLDDQLSSWVFCPHCHFSGTLVDLISKHLNVSINSIFYQLLAADPTIDYVDLSELSTKCERNRQIVEFWQSCINRQIKPYQYSKAAERHQLALYNIFRIANNSFIGATERRLLNVFLKSVDVKKPVNNKWTRGIILPVWGLPGKIVKFVVLTDNNDSLTVVNLNNGKEDGVIGPIFDCVVSKWLIDPKLIASIQKHEQRLRLHTSPPAMLSNLPNGYKFNHSLVKLLKLHQSVVLIDDVTAASVKLASVFDSSVGATSGNIGHRQWFDQCFSDMVDWKTVVNQKLKVGHDVKFIVDSQIDSVSMTALMAHCDKEIVERLKDVETTAIGKDVDGARIIEMSDGWHRLGGVNSKISDTVVRIEKIDYYYRKKTITGKFLRNGRSTEFMAPYGRINDLYSLMVDTFVKAGLQAPNVKKTWRSRLFEVATHFHKPLIVDHHIVVGWQNNKASFILNGWILPAGSNTPQKAETTFERSIPLKSIDKASIEGDKQWITGNDYEIGLGWLTLIHSIRNLVATAINQPQTNLLLVGDRAWRIARAVHEPLNSLVIGNPDKLTDKVQHDWSTIFYVKCREDWHNLTGYTNLIAKSNQEDAVALGFKTNAQILTSNYAAPNVSVNDNVNNVILGYLADLCSRHLYLPALAYQGLSIAVIDDVCDWLIDKVEPREISAVQQAKRALIVNDHQSHKLTNFSNVLIDAMFSKRLNFVNNVKDVKSNTDLVYVPKPARLFIPFAALPAAIGKTVISGYQDTVTTALTDQGVLCDVGEISGEKGWVIRESWWNQELDRKQPTLKLAKAV